MAQVPSSGVGAGPALDRKGSPLSPFLSWLIIALSIGLLFYKRQGTDESTMLPAGPSNQTGDFQVRFLGRYAVGVNRILPESQRLTTGKQIIEQFRRAARTPAGELRAAIVIGEVAGADAALDEIRQIDFSGNPLLHNDALVLGKIWGNKNVDEARLTPDERADLLDHHGWFGRLALTWGLADASTLRREAMAPAIRTAVTGISLGFAIIGLGFVGLILLVIAIVLFATGVMRRAYVPPTRPTGALLEAFALWIAWYVGVSFVAGQVKNPTISRAVTIVAMCAPLAALWPLVRGFNCRDLKFGLGWHSGRGFIREIGAGVAAYIAGMPIVLLGIGITLLITRKTGITPSHPIVNEISAETARVLKLLLLASVYAPIVEETMFRGALYSYLRRRFFWPIAGLLVAFLFAAIHPQGFAAVPALMGLAFVFAAMREWRNSLIAPITAHALNNAILIIALVLMAG